MIIPNVITPLNTSSYTAIVLPGSGVKRPVSYFTDDESAFIEAVDESGTGASTIPEKTKVNLSADIKYPSDILLWAKATAGAPNLIVKIGLPV